MTDYQSDLERLLGDIAEARVLLGRQESKAESQPEAGVCVSSQPEAGVVILSQPEAGCGPEARPTDHLNIEQATLQAYRLYQLASLTGRGAYFEDAERFLGETLARYGPREDLCLLKANLDMRFHRLGAVRADLEKMKGRPAARSILADVDFQEGRYEAARREYEALIALDPVWDDMARLGHWYFKMGDFARAEEWLERAGEELTAKQMRSFAWVLVQRGVVALSRGDAAAAWAFYERAARAYSGYWLIDEHFAELLAFEERYEEAEALYLRLPERPELLQTVGELYLKMDLPERAGPFLDRAEAAYLESAEERGEVHYWHHLADFYADVRVNGDAAVHWAGKDLAMRPNFNTQAAMGLALCVAGRCGEAGPYLELALASGARDSHLFEQAAVVWRGTGRLEDAEKYEALAVQINPMVGRFHVHR